MKAPPFAYEAPTTLDEAVALKAGGGEQTLFLAGGQSLLPLLALRLASPSTLVDLGRIPGLDGVVVEDGGLRVGAMARHRDVEDAGDLLARVPVLADAVPLIGHPAIRNRGTVGGSIAHADPAAEWPALALALDAVVFATGPSGDRELAAGDFFLGPFETALAPDEVVREVRFRIPAGPGVGSALVEHARRHGDLAIAGAAAVIGLGADGRVSTARVALLGLGGTPLRASEAERGLVGQVPTDSTIDTAAAAAGSPLEPPSDVHASGRYRRHLARVVVARALRLARDRAGVAA